jgi:hypothetical protein
LAPEPDDILLDIETFDPVSQTEGTDHQNVIPSEIPMVADQVPT